MAEVLSPRPKILVTEIEFSPQETEAIEDLYERPIDELTDIVSQKQRDACPAGDQCCMVVACERGASKRKFQPGRDFGMPGHSYRWTGTAVTVEYAADCDNREIIEGTKDGIMGLYWAVEDIKRQGKQIKAQIETEAEGSVAAATDQMREAARAALLGSE